MSSSSSLAGGSLANQSRPTITWQVEQAICPSQVPSSGIPAAWQPLLLYGAASFDLLLGLAIIVLPRRRWLWLVQLVLIGFYSIVIAWKLPEFLLHPYGPLTKNLPMLAAIWLLLELEEN